MKPYGEKYSFKKKGSFERGNKSYNIPSLNLKLIHKIFDTVNISLLTLIFILLFISFNSQREWSNIYKILSKTKTNNNNLIDYISKTEEFYISEIDSLKIYKKTTPNDLIYFNKFSQKKDNFINQKIINIINGLKDSKYERGY